MVSIMLIGNMTKDPEITEGANYKYCKFSLACTIDSKDKDGKRKTNFWNCTAWNGLADTIVKFCKKGSKLSVIGTCEQNKRNDKEGIERTYYDVRVKDIEFLSPKGNTEDVEEEPPVTNRPQIVPDYSDDDIPF